MNRRRVVYAVAVLSVAAFAAAFFLIHGVGHQTVQGAKTDPSDPDAPAETTRVRVECASPASGPRLTDDGNTTGVGDLENADGVAEDDGRALDQEGVDLADVSDVCGRLRTERLAHAGELGVLGLLLAGSAVLLALGKPDVRRAPSGGRAGRGQRVRALHDQVDHEPVRADDRRDHSGAGGE